MDADVCVVGAGLAGMSAAYELAAAGMSVVCIEARRVGWGASGRNGGFVFPGFSLGSHDLVRQVGRADAKTLYQLSLEAVDRVRARISRHQMGGVDPTHGVLEVVRYANQREADQTREFMDHVLGHSMRLVGRDELQTMLRTDDYYWGLEDKRAFHMHPLNYMHGLSRACQQMGVRVFEQSPATSVDCSGGPDAAKTVRVAGSRGEVRARHVVHCSGAYFVDSLPRDLASSTLPVATYVVSTAPIPESVIRSAINTDAAVLDTRRCGDYYRVVWQKQEHPYRERTGRILWGGRISALVHQPAALSSMLLGDMIRVFPQLDGHVTIDAAWSGLMPYTRHMMPLIGRLPSGEWYAAGYCGHGLNTTAMGAALVAGAVTGTDDRWKLLDRHFGLSWAGGSVIGPLATQASYWWMQLQDYIQESRSSAVTSGARV